MSERPFREAKIQAQNDRAATNPTQNSSTYTVVSFQFTTNSIFPVKPTLSHNLLQILEFTSRLPCHVVMKKCKMVSEWLGEHEISVGNHDATQMKQKSLFGTERSLLRIRTKSKQQPMMCKPLCHPMTSRKITEGGRVGGKKNKTVQYKISGVRLR